MSGNNYNECGCISHYQSDHNGIPRLVRADAIATSDAY
jgi:hypothetical protein